MMYAGDQDVVVELNPRICFLARYAIWRELLLSLSFLQ